MSNAQLSANARSAGISVLPKNYFSNCEAMPMLTVAKKLAENLSCWQEPVLAIPLDGGLTNTNFKVRYRNEDYVIRIGEDIPEHGIMRFNELNASRAAFQAGISPEITHSEKGALVIRFIEGDTLNAADVRNQDMLQRILQLVNSCH
ncbi:MAG: phosphotransferase family protein, partial [Pseudomonadales bacterium]|nr:phosphotransferase family protein [Pseudomonadales bacterium]